MQNRSCTRDPSRRTSGCTGRSARVSRDVRPSLWKGATYGDHLTESAPSRHLDFVTLFVLATCAFGAKAWTSFMADRLSWNVPLYSLAALGTLSMALRYGRDAVRATRRTHSNARA